MSKGTQFSRDVGLDVALKMLAAIGDVCTRVAIAGSIRRGKAEVGDVELVVQPAIQHGANLLEGRMNGLLKSGLVEKRHAWGERYKALKYVALGVPVDLFVVLPDRQWGPTMVIRTGPGAANESLVTQVGQRTRNGVAGVRPPGVYFKDGALWDDRVRRIDTPEEVDVYRALGLPWVAPHLRTAATYQTIARRHRQSGYLRGMLRDSARGYVGCARMPLRESVWWPGENGVAVNPSPWWYATGKNVEMSQETLL